MQGVLWGLREDSQRYIMSKLSPKKIADVNSKQNRKGGW